MRRCRGKSKSSPEDFRRPSRGRFFINCFALPAALGIPSPASRIFGRESKYPPAQSICKLRNKCRSCVINFLARSGFYLLRAQRIAGHIEPRQDFLRCRPPVKRSPENRAFLPFAGSLSAAFFCSCGKFQIFS